MKEKFLGVCLTAILAGVVAAQEPPAPPEEGQEPAGPSQAGFQPMMEPEHGPGMMGGGMPMPEKMQEAMAQRGQRRYEIMILLQAYRILPEADRAPIEKAIRERLKADYEEHQAFSKVLIARLEKQLTKMKEREAKADPEAAVEQEFKRLLNAPIPMIVPAGQMGGPAMMGPGPGPMGQENGMMQQRGMGKNNEGRQRQMMRGRRHQEQPGAGPQEKPELQLGPAAPPEAAPQPPTEDKPQE
ncbi:MAG: hypothetical protein AB7F40_00445 [Victivallaceae bacterium]|nr:hypothetical protein [Victivallaceae bacterium]